MAAMRPSGRGCRFKAAEWAAELLSLRPGDDAVVYGAGAHAAVGGLAPGNLSAEAHTAAGVQHQRRVGAVGHSYFAVPDTDDSKRREMRLREWPDDRGLHGSAVGTFRSIAIGYPPFTAERDAELNIAVAVHDFQCFASNLLIFSQ